MGNRRFEMYEYRQIISRMRLGESDRAISKAGLMGRKKVAKLRILAKNHDWLDPTNTLPDDNALNQALKPQELTQPQESSVLPFKKEVEDWVSSNVSGTVILRTLQEKHDYEGGYSSVKRFIKKLKDSAPPDATVMLDFDPGEVAQVDFGKGPEIIDVTTGEVISTHFFVMTLAWSRHQYAEIVRDQKLTTWLGCHRRAFEFFNGIPARVMIDNLKAGIIKACWHDPVVQRSYGECAEDYGFIISPCPPRDPKKKGRVESGVKYIKNNFLPLKTFRSLADANHQLMEWIMNTAGIRIHGTTRKQPLVMFNDTELYILKKLPDIPPELAIWATAKLHGNCHLQHEKSYYSAPYKLIRQKLWLKITENIIKIFHNFEMVAIHPRAHYPGTKETVLEHLPPEAVAYKMQDPQWCLKQAGKIGGHCHDLIEVLFSDKVLDNLRAAQGIVRLKTKYSGDRLNAACKRALEFDNPRYHTVKSILEKGLEQHESIGDSELPQIYKGDSTFCRNSNTLTN